MQCASNLRQIGIALHNCAEDHAVTVSGDERCPYLPLATVRNRALPVEQRLSWYVAILPYVEEGKLYQQFDLDIAWNAGPNGTASTTPLSKFRCPDWDREAWKQPRHFTPYLGVAGVGPDAATLPPGSRLAGLFNHDWRTALRDITDGTSNTLMILESGKDNGPWAQGGRATTRGIDPQTAPYLGTGRPFGGTHFAENGLLGRGSSIGCNALFADCSVRFLRETIPPAALEGLATKSGGETVLVDME